MDKKFLPVTREEMLERGWDQVDFVYVCGDAYVDHSSFGAAIITRVLEAHGYRIGMIAQPDWKDEKSIQVFGMPRLGFMVSAGNMDSMVNHYTVSKKRRSSDAYTPGGVAGKRPDYATVVYCNLIRRVYKQVPIIIGGIEASLRRLAHYDYWSNSLKHSILVDSQANILIYGMGELAVVEVAEALESGIAVEDITYVEGTAYRTKNLDAVYDAQMLPSYEELCRDKKVYAESFYTQYCNTDHFTAKCLVEKYNDHLYVVQNPPARPLTQMELDDVYALPYMMIYLLGTFPSMATTGLNPFINAQGYATTGMLSITIGAVANLILDPIFIYVLHMNVAGAALATIISQFVSCIWVLSFLFGKKTIIKIRKEYLLFELLSFIPSNTNLAFPLLSVVCVITSIKTD